MRALCSRVVKALSGKITRAVEELRALETMTSDEITEFQIARLNNLLQHFKTYPFYAKLLDEHGISGTKLSSLEDLKRFPVVTKDIITANLAALAGRPEAQLLGSTSGSTGKNFRFYQSREMLLYRRAQNILHLEWIGIDHWRDKKFSVWGLSPKTYAFEPWLQALKVYFQNSMRVQAFGMNEQRCIDILKQLQRFNPSYINAYPGYAFELACAGIKHKIAPPTVQAICVSGETLLDHQAAAIREYFRCRLFNRYGSREFGAIAHERIGGNGLYVHPAKAVVETDADGDLLITDLTNTATPFIRYAIGDAGTVVGPSPDSSGLCHQRITGLMGRTHDSIKTRSGKLLPGQFLTIMTKKVPGIDMFQFVQRDAEHIDLNIVTGPDYSDEHEHKLHKELWTIVGDEIRMRVVKVDRIELTPSGKRKFVIKCNPGAT